MSTLFITLPIAEVSGKALDYLVATALGWKDKHDEVEKGRYWHTNDAVQMFGSLIQKSSFTPTKLWSQGGPIKTKHRISTSIKHDGWWVATIYDMNDEPGMVFLAHDELTAAMRCLVYSVLGFQVAVHSELLESLNLVRLKNLWAQLGDIPTVYSGDDVDQIEEPFLHFKAGTHREVIWRWFESMNKQFVVGAIMSEGIPA